MSVFTYVQGISTIDFFLIYLLLARLCKRWSRKFQIHSFVHSIVSWAVGSYLLFFLLERSPFETNFVTVLNNISPEYEPSLRLYIYHSLGYFFADTLDIIIDHGNVGRRVYIVHHVSAILGLSTVYWGSYVSVYPIWAFELGGIVYHLKYMAKIYRVSPVPNLIIHLLYHLVFLTSRCLVGINIISAYNTINKINTNSSVGVVGVGIASVLLLQNVGWWIRNVKKSFD